MLPPRIFCLSCVAAARAANLAHAGRHRHVAAEQQAVDAEHADGHLDDPLVDHAAAGVEDTRSGAWRRALIVHSQSPPPPTWAQISMASG